MAEFLIILGCTFGAIALAALAECLLEAGMAITVECEVDK